mgnify:CR=1 FL=1
MELVEQSCVNRRKWANERRKHGDRHTSIQEAERRIEALKHSKFLAYEKYSVGESSKEQYLQRKQ